MTFYGESIIYVQFFPVYEGEKGIGAAARGGRIEQGRIILRGPQGSGQEIFRTLVSYRGHGGGGGNRA